MGWGALGFRNLREEASELGVFSRAMLDGIARAPVSVAVKPLIGGPQWLPVHLALLIGSTTFDFVPARPRERATAVTLLRGGEVDGEVRIRECMESEQRWLRIGETRRSMKDLRAFARARPERLSLVRNNCWTFALALGMFALLAEPESETAP